ncbi:hypothetical protein OsI_03988 [Oryza sativa Indica Group]|uniref:R13L1/DRL21-like LRR repeat region domain-containing protein n=1 Tax=Oryza sativa subsp. indica TaxID=39946 RepID=A2WVR4_ORYSI|nr:hypothetical protein OsI_03988 [Oryza sativa Indica Group]
MDVSHLEILEGLRPPSQLEDLTIEGYKSAMYPSWLLDGSYFENLESFTLANCCGIGSLPPNTEIFRHCLTLTLENVPNMKTLSFLPEGLTSLSIVGCPLLVFTTNNDELEHHDYRESITRANNLETQLVLIWEADSDSDIRRTLLSEHSSMKKLTELMDTDISGNLQTIESALKIERDEALVKEDIIKVWLCCHEERMRFIYSRKLARGAEFMQMSLEKLCVYNCVLSADFFCGDWPHLDDILLSGCRSSSSLHVGDLTSLESFSLYHFPDLCTLEGLSSLQLHHVHLIDVPKLTTESISQFRVQRSLYISSSVMLNHMLSAEGFVVPEFLSLESCKEPSVSFEESANFTSVKCLRLCNCEMRSPPGNMKCLSSLTKLDIYDCPKISSIPDLPSSLQHICIWGCELLKESCRAPEGESWPKIAHIRWKEFR